MEPKVNLTAEQAGEDLFLWEISAIERHFKSGFDSMYSGDQLTGLIWVFENRLASEKGEPKVTWETVARNFKIGDMKTYFAESDPDPDSEQANLSES